MPHTLIVDDRERLVKAFVELATEAVADGVAARGQFTAGVTGGRDGVGFLSALAGAPVDWRLARIFFGDERAVAPADPESNYGQLKQAWLDPAGVPPDRVYRMHGEAPDLAAAAREYEATLVKALGPAPAFDLLVLGMGPDGHVCSLFPGHAALSERERLATAVLDSPKPPPRRLTLTLPALAHARLTVVLASAPDKRPALDAALHDPDSPLPVAHVLRAASRAVVLAGGVRHH